MAEHTDKAWEKRLQEVGDRVEQDLKRLVTYLNDEVVPDVRRSGATALRSAAAELQRLAQQMDDRRSGPDVPPPVDKARP